MSLDLVDRYFISKLVVLDLRKHLKIGINPVNIRILPDLILTTNDICCSFDDTWFVVLNAHYGRLP